MTIVFTRDTVEATPRHLRCLSVSRLDAYTETENVRRRNVQLEIQFKELEAAVRERDLEIRYLSEKMDKEVETVVRERDMVTQRMQEELHTVQGQLAEA